MTVTRTEALGMHILGILMDNQRVPLEECAEIREDILKACKDAGLKFITHETKEVKDYTEDISFDND